LAVAIAESYTLIKNIGYNFKKKRQNGLAFKLPEYNRQLFKRSFLLRCLLRYICYVLCFLLALLMCFY